MRNNGIARKIVITIIGTLVITSLLYSAGVLKHHIREARDTKISFVNEDKIVDSIRKYLKLHYVKIAINFEADGRYIDDIEEIVTQWIDKALMPTGVADEGDYLKFQIGNYKISYVIEDNKLNNKYTVYIEPEYYTTLKQEEEVNEKINKIMMLLELDMDTSEVEKVERIYEYIYTNVQYDKVHKNNMYYHLDSTAYAALTYKNASCQGYSVLASRLLLEAGIDNKIVTGYATKDDKEEYHAWNLVRLGNKYYNMDITWDKQLESPKYFLKCNNTFIEHKRDLEYTNEEFMDRYPSADRDFYP